MQHDSSLTKENGIAEPFLAQIRIAGLNFAARLRPLRRAETAHQSRPVAALTVRHDLRRRQSHHFGPARTARPYPHSQGKQLWCQSQLGLKPGEETLILTVNEMPAHNHQVTGSTGQETDDPACIIVRPSPKVLTSSRVPEGRRTKRPAAR